MNNISNVFDELIKTWNQHDADAAATYYDENISWRDYSLSQPFRGVEEATAAFKSYVKAFPDLQLKILNKLVAEDMVAIQIEFTGTNTGPFEFPGFTFPPTNKKVVTTDAIFLKFRNGKLIEVHDYPDVQGMMEQLGLQPDHAEQQQAV